MKNQTIRNKKKKPFMIVDLILGVLFLSSAGFTQDYFSETVVTSRGIKSIDIFPERTEKESIDRAKSRAPETPLFPFEETFSLHSLSGATKVIYLDFDGHIGEEGKYGPFNYEGNGNSFSEKEHIIIQHAWKSIAAAFLPFEVDVTTEDPGVEALRKTGKNDTEWGVRCVINHNSYNYSWAYIGSFSAKVDRELYVWSGKKGASIFDTWFWISGSVNHEVGHTLGLTHDGKGNIEYYKGHGKGLTEWCPIMGWGGDGVNHWDKGEYTGSNNQQDDLQIITTKNGFGYRTDDHGSTTGTATTVDISASFLAEGIIEQNTDIDFFAFTMASSDKISLAIAGDSIDTMLDILAKIHDEDGTVLYESNPPTALNASFDVTLPAGNYYLSIDGTGYDDPTSFGYSDYGSLGYYSITSDTPVSNYSFQTPIHVLSIHHQLSTHSLTITFPSDANEASIYTLKGVQIKKFDNPGNTITLNTKGLAKGVYFIRALVDGSSIVRKVML